MLSYFRYALAMFCFAASVGCFALWWRSMSTRERFEILPSPGAVETEQGFAAIGPLPDALIVKSRRTPLPPPVQHSLGIDLCERSRFVAGDGGNVVGAF